jgi:hypothetical protein
MHHVRLKVTSDLQARAAAGIGLMDDGAAGRGLGRLGRRRAGAPADSAALAAAADGLSGAVLGRGADGEVGLAGTRRQTRLRAALPGSLAAANGEHGQQHQGA